jgi:GT2 family glycosyltransferase
MGEGINFIKVKLISVSLVMYCNELEELKIAINCCLQSELVGKIYLVDNSPADDLQVLRELDINRIVYLFQNANLGFGRAHNVGIKLAAKEGYSYHLILNPDVEFEMNVLQELHSYMKANLGCGMVTPKVYYKNGDLQYLCKKLPSAFQMFGKRIPIKFLQNYLNKQLELRHFDYNRTMNIPYLSGCFMFCRMEAFKKVGLFDDRYFMYMEDLDLSRRFHEKYETIFYPKVSIIHGFRSESKANRKLLVALIVSAIKYYTKYGWFFDQERKQINKKLLKRISELNKA